MCSLTVTLTVSLFFISLHSVGIVRQLSGLLPLGSTDRVVFEALCFSCTGEDDLSDLQYQWLLMKSPQQDESFISEYSERAKRGSQPVVALSFIDDGAPIDWFYILPKVTNVSVNSNCDFLPRFRDYRKIYYANSVDELVKHSLKGKLNSSHNFYDHRSSEFSESNNSSADSFKEHDENSIKLRRGAVADYQSDASVESEQEKKRLPISEINKQNKTFSIDSVDNLSKETLAMDKQKYRNLKSTVEQIASSSMRYDDFFLPGEREDIEIVEKLVGMPIDHSLVHRARELYVQSVRRKRLTYKNHDWKMLSDNGYLGKLETLIMTRTDNALLIDPEDDGNSNFDKNRKGDRAQRVHISSDRRVNSGDLETRHRRGVPDEERNVLVDSDFASSPGE